MGTTKATARETAESTKKTTARATARAEKPNTREKRVRRAFDRRGLELRKSRARDPQHLHFGLFYVVDRGTKRAVVTWSTLDFLEYWLNLTAIDRRLDSRPSLKTNVRGDIGGAA